MSAGFDIRFNSLFKYSGSESEIVIPEGVKSIDFCAFNYCKSLKIIHISSNVEFISDEAFEGCKNLTEFNVDPANEYYSVQDGMLVNKAKDTLVCFPAGKNISEYVIPENITTIARKAFIDCRKLKKIVIPASVKVIKDEVFPRCYTDNEFMFEEIEIDPKACSLGIGYKVFDFKDEKQPLVYPKLPLTFVEEEAALRLCLGYCLNPSIYDGEYAEIYQKYAKSHATKLLEMADYSIILDIIKYYCNVLDTNSLYKEIKGQAAVELLEKVILSGDVEQVKQVIEGCKDFELKARALGLACLYSNLEMVKVLVESGLTFDYEYSIFLKRRYGVAYSNNNNIYHANYSLLLVKTNIDVWHPIIQTSAYDLHFGIFDFELVNEKLENSHTVRADIVEYLLTQPKTNFDSSSTLFYSILWGCNEVAQRLIQNGVKLSEKYIDLLSESSRAYERTELLSTLSALSASKALYALETFKSLLDGTKKKIMLTQIVFEIDKTSMLDPDVLKYIFTETDTSKINKSKLLEKIIDKEDVKALKTVVETGTIKTKGQREKAIAYATKQKKNEALAWLIDYKNRNVVLAKEEAREEAKILKKLMEDPNSVSVLKKKWRYVKLEDGTLYITSYKGSELEVEVPAKIGEEVVTVVGENAFTTLGRMRNRKKIQKVIIPEGIVEIGWGTFYGCKSLEMVVLPSSLKKIDDRAFSDCENLTTINIPKGVTIGCEVFDGCTKLQNKDGMIIIDEVLYKCPIVKENGSVIVIPEGVKKIADDAFVGSLYPIEKIVLPQGLEEIDEYAFRLLHELKQINIPSSIKEIKWGTFSDKGLEKIEFDDGLKIIGYAAFSENDFKEIRIPKTVTTIEARAFFKCFKLKDVYIPSSVVKFGEDVFGDFDSYGISWYQPHGLVVHTPKGSATQEYMEQYSDVKVVNDYPQE